MIKNSIKREQSESRLSSLSNVRILREANKSFYILTAVVAMCFASCEKYDHAISDIEDRLDKIEGTSLTTIDQQIAAIKGSIADLEKVDAELDGYIKSLQTTAADLQTQLDATNEKIENVKKEMDEDIDAVEQNLLNELNKLKTYIEGELVTINNTIAALQEKDAELDQKIADLRTYVDNKLANYATKDWANATFSTLTQYLEIQNAIADIESDIKNINESLKDLEIRINENIAADIEAEINALENKMQGWVSEQLQQPLKDIADLQAALNALTGEVATDEELAAAVAAQKNALKEAVDDLTAAYEKAIKDAVADGGIINAAIAAAVATAQDNLQAQIDAINGEIEKIKARLDIIELDIRSIKQQIANLLDQIQSVTFIPQYSDGKVEMDYISGQTSLDFMINPQRLSTALVEAWENNNGTENSIIKAYVRYTNDPTTRAVANPIELTVADVTSSTGGMINIEVKDNKPSLLSEDFWLGKQEAVIYIVITNGVTEIASEAIPMIAHNYAGNTNSIDGFGDGDTQSGEAGQ